MHQYSQILLSANVLKFNILEDERKLQYKEVIQKWKTDEIFRDFFSNVLAEAPFQAFFWETPPISQSSINQVFEFVLIDSPILNRVKPEISAFEKYFLQNTDYEGVVSFPNLGKDALLVVPCAWEAIDINAYTHLANFVRKAPQKQQHSLWQNLAYVLDNQLNNKALWLSTSGLGVYWLHIRIDTIPKYYHHQPYKLIH